MHSWQSYMLNLAFRSPIKHIFKLNRDLNKIRGLMNRTNFWAKPAKGVTSTKFNIDHMTAEWIKPMGCDLPDVIVLYLHGGGYCLGSIRSHHTYLTYFSTLVKCGVLSIDYRLAPEHPFPAALDDSMTAYRCCNTASGTKRLLWLVNQRVGVYVYRLCSVLKSVACQCQTARCAYHLGWI